LKNNVRHSLRASTWDGVFAAAAAAVLDNFVAPLAIALHASASQIASLASLPNLVAAFAHLQAGPLKNRLGSRKAILVTGVGLQVVCAFAIAFVPKLAPPWPVPALIGLMIAFAVLGGFATPMWCSMMCEYLPLSRRSGYFGWRSRFLGSVTIVTTIVCGFVLHHFGRGYVAGFVVLIAAAAAFRLVSLRFLAEMYEPSTPRSPAGEAPSYRWLLRAHRGYIRFILTVGLMGFCVHLSGPFVTMYLLKELKLGYGVYTLLLLASQAASFWMMGRWGRSADRAGNMKVIQTTAKLLPLTALVWIFSPHPAYLFAAQLFVGFVWAGYNLCVGNFVYDSVPSRQRVHATALSSTVNSIAAFAGASVGGWLINILPPIAGQRFFTLILLGAAARFSVGWFLFPKLREVRSVTHTRGRDLLFTVVRLDPGTFVTRLAFWRV
jgi:MFS family permease